RGGRKRVRLADAAAEALDHAVPDREGGVQRDLLRGDRGHEGLERVRRERGTQAGELAGQAREHRLAVGPLVERGEIELHAEELADGRPRLRVQRLDADAAARGRDPNLAAADDAVQRTFEPEVREVRPERAVA